MSLPEIKQRLIEQIQSSTDEALMVELLDMVEHQNSTPKFSAEQTRILQERIDRVEEGRATYLDAKQLAEQIKKELNDL